MTQAGRDEARVWALIVACLAFGGLLLWLAGCATTVQVHEPALCRPWGLAEQEDYEALREADLLREANDTAPRSVVLREWVVSVSQVCRANAAMRGTDW